MRPALHCTSLLILFLLGSGAFAQDTTYRGTEFWVGYGLHQTMENGTNSQRMTLYISTGSQPAVVTVTIDSSGATPADSSTWWKRTFNIPANTAIDIQTAGAVGGIPKSGSYDARLYSPAAPIGNSSSGIFRGKAIRIQSDVPVAAYSHIYSTTSSGATMLVPLEAWGGLYYSANSNQRYATDTYSWMYIIARYDNTVVEITPTVKTRAQNVTGLQPGVTKTITLMKGQIYQLMGANINSDADGNGGSGPQAYELTGTRVKSVTSPTGYIHPIAVFSGSSRTLNDLSCGSGGGDNDMQQHFPRQALGKVYLTAPTSQSGSASAFMINSYKVVVGDPATVVTRNGVALTGLVNNSYYIFESNLAERIEADQPVLLAQFMGGGTGCNGTGQGDPEMFYISPLSQAINTAIFFRNTIEVISVNYLTLIIPTAGLATLTIDGSGTFDHSYPHPQMAGYSVVVKRWPASQSQCVVSSTSPFTGITYGLGSVESYGYNLGTRLNAVNARDASVLPAGFTGEVLPVTLLDFNGTKSNADVLLRWRTTNEVNLDRFQIQRSPDGIHFSTIGVVQAGIAPANSYHHTDAGVLTASNTATFFYRLKMIDKDGSYGYSGIVQIKSGNTASLGLQTWPNPVKEKFFVQVESAKSGNAQLLIRNVAGHILTSYTRFIQAGTTTIQLDGAALPATGVYVVELILNGERRYSKLVR